MRRSISFQANLPIQNDYRMHHIIGVFRIARNAIDALKKYYFAGNVQQAVVGDSREFGKSFHFSHSSSN